MPYFTRNIAEIPRLEPSTQKFFIQKIIIYKLIKNGHFLKDDDRSHHKNLKTDGAPFSLNFHFMVVWVRQKIVVDHMSSHWGVFVAKKLLSVEICPNIEEYARLIGVPHDYKEVIISCFEPSFKQRLSRTWGTKKKLLEVGNGSLEYKRCPLTLLCELYGVDESHNCHEWPFL